MSIKRFRASAGRLRVGKSVAPSTASYTRSMRASMDAIIKEYARFAEHMSDETINVLEEAMKPTFQLSQKYTPRDTGKLVKSGYLQTTEFRKTKIVEIGYGKGGEPDYAAAVHENLEWQHESPTQAKFLERALQEDKGNIQARIVQGLRYAGGLS